MSNFFTSDTHFSQERTLELSKRPFKTIQEMDMCIIANWNKMVQTGDTVYHLGDFGNFDVLPYLNGNIILIKGNYENELKGISKYACDTLRIVNDYFITLNDIPVYLNHFPSKMRSGFNLFGHIHRLCMVKRFSIGKENYMGLNVGIDTNHFNLYSEEDILWQYNGILNHYDHEVFYPF